MLGEDGRGWMVVVIAVALMNWAGWYRPGHRAASPHPAATMLDRVPVSWKPVPRTTTCRDTGHELSGSKDSRRQCGHAMQFQAIDLCRTIRKAQCRMY